MNITKEQADQMQARVKSKAKDKLPEQPTGYHTYTPSQEATKIVLYELIPGLNGDKGLMRSHWSKHKKKLEIMTYQIKAATNNRHEGQVRVTYTRYYATLPMDWDNMASTAKIPFDALVKAGVIKDDNPRIVVEFIPKQIKVATKAEQRTEILIEDID